MELILTRHIIVTMDSQAHLVSGPNFLGQTASFGFVGLCEIAGAGEINYSVFALDIVPRLCQRKVLASEGDRDFLCREESQTPPPNTAGCRNSRGALAPKKARFARENPRAPFFGAPFFIGHDLPVPVAGFDDVFVGFVVAFVVGLAVALVGLTDALVGLTDALVVGLTVALVGLTDALVVGLAFKGLTDTLVGLTDALVGLTDALVGLTVALVVGLTVALVGLTDALVVGLAFTGLTDALVGLAFTGLTTALVGLTDALVGLAFTGLTTALVGLAFTGLAFTGLGAALVLVFFCLFSRSVVWNRN